MTFLAPIAGAIAGGVGLLVLLALHALKLRRRPLRVSSTLLWKDAARDLEVNIPWRAPRPTLLLFLQALALLMLAAAIARPVIGDTDTIPGRIILVVDASASMDAIDDPNEPSRLQTAIDRAKERLSRLRRASTTPEIAVVRAAASPTLLLAPTRSIDAAIRAVESIEQSDQPLDPHDVAALVQALSDQSPAPEEIDESDADAESGAAPTEVLVYTDDADPFRSVFAGVPGEIVGVVGSETLNPNTGIVSAIASRDPTDPALVRVFVRVVSTDRRDRGAVVRVQSGDRQRALAVTVPPRSESGPGAATGSVEFRLPTSATIEVSVEPGGSLVSDDRVWIDMPSPAPPRTVVFAPDGRADPFLMDVLNELLPGAVSVHSRVELDALQGAELVIYDRVTPQRLPRVPSLGFGSAIPEGPTENEDTPLKSGRSRILAWQRQHPVLRDLSLGSIVFDRAVELPDQDTPGVTVLAETASTPAMIELTGLGLRHLRVAFPLSRSNWGADFGMLIFVASSVEHLLPGTRGTGQLVTTAQTLDLKSTTSEISAEGPASIRSAPARNGVASIGPFPMVGVYDLSGADQGSIGVSLLSIQESGVSVSPGAVLGASQTGRGLSDSRRELWPIMLMIAAGLMTLEWLAHAWQARV